MEADDVQAWAWMRGYQKLPWTLKQVMWKLDQPETELSSTDARQLAETLADVIKQAASDNKALSDLMNRVARQGEVIAALAKRVLPEGFTEAELKTLVSAL